MENNKITFEQLKERIIKIEDELEFNLKIHDSLFGAFRYEYLEKIYTLICIVNEELLDHIEIYYSKLDDGVEMITIGIDDSYNMIDFTDIITAIKLIVRNDYSSEPMSIDIFRLYVTKFDINIMTGNIEASEKSLKNCNEVLNFCLLVTPSIKGDTRDEIYNTFNHLFDRYMVTLDTIYDEYCNLNTRDMILINRMLREGYAVFAASKGDILNIKELSDIDSGLANKPCNHNDDTGSELLN